MFCAFLQLLADFYTYKGNEKAEAVGKQLDAVGLFTNLQARLANHKRPAWRAPDGTNPEELDKLFEELAEVHPPCGRVLSCLLC